MAEGHRLGALHMGEARHHRPGMGERLVGERRHQLAHLAVDGVDGVAHPQAEIGRHLIVARARGVQPPGRRADQFGEAGLHVHVDVLIGLAEREAALADLGRDRVQPPLDGA